MEDNSRAKTNAYFRSYYQKNKEKIKATQKKYYEKNRDRLTIQIREKYHNDDEHRQRKLKKMAEYRNRMRSPVIQQQIMV